LNGLFPLFCAVKEFINARAETNFYSENIFSLMEFLDHAVYEAEYGSGDRWSLKCNERHYTPSEINWLVQSIGFTSSAEASP